MTLSTLEKNVLTMSLGHMHEQLTDVYADYKEGNHYADIEIIEDRLHALQTLTIKLLGA
jgi:hypothetical protein